MRESSLPFSSTGPAEQAVREKCRLCRNSQATQIANACLARADVLFAFAFRTAGLSLAPLTLAFSVRTADQCLSLSPPATKIQIVSALSSAALLLAALCIHAWLAAHDDQLRLASTLATQKQALDAADARERDRNATLKDALAQIDTLKRTAQNETPAQLARALQDALSLPQPITVGTAASSDSSVEARHAVPERANSTAVSFGNGDRATDGRTAGLRPARSLLHPPHPRHPAMTRTRQTFVPPSIKASALSRHTGGFVLRPGNLRSGFVCPYQESFGFACASPTKARCWKSSAMERWFHQPSIRSFHHDSRCRLPGFPRRQVAHSASGWIDRFHHGATRATPQTNQLRQQCSVIGPAAQHPVQPHRQAARHRHLRNLTPPTEFQPLIQPSAVPHLSGPPSARLRPATSALSNCPAC